MTEPLPTTLYSHLIFRFRLPFRLFVDEGVYPVAAGGVQWRVTIKDVPRSSIDYTIPPIDFGRRSQLQLDNHGAAGCTEVTSGYPFAESLSQPEIMARQTSAERIALSDVLAPINRLISLYRSKTREFWFRTLGVKDIVAYSSFILPVGSTASEFFLTDVRGEIAIGYPFLKSEEWYDDLLARLDREQSLPLFYDIWHEAQDALERDNLRLCASLLPLAAENLFRRLLVTYFPDEVPPRNASQMLGRYFSRYNRVAEPKSLSLRKKEAMRHLLLIWQQRDLLLHGHDVFLAREDVTAATAAFARLVPLWESRPSGDILRVEGPFVSFGALDFPTRSVDALLRRATNRFHGGHVFDSLEAARFALVVEPTNRDAQMLAGVCDMRLGNCESAVERFRAVLNLVPDWEPATRNLELALASLAATERSSMNSESVQREQMP